MVEFVLREARNDMKRTIFFVILFAIALGNAFAQESTSTCCGKNRTAVESLQKWRTSRNASGTAVILLLQRHSMGKTILTPYYLRGVTYDEAIAIGSRAEGYYWVAPSIASYDVVRSDAKYQFMRVCPADNGCSCPNGGSCYDQPNGGCFCNCD
ncbi:protein of unknown function [Paraburkholderia dioscoreae]|uniref:Uncharacterized protein n=1 Tax=Paraburkholderia dioscoreae TaxID=2604047 RepID=A0A5Q4ZES3_9BURK|nr:protein of unknown function [Paraburkholderia dioscoreae]